MGIAADHALDGLDESQYARAREGVGLLERGERGKLVLTGGEAAEFLQGQVTNDVEALAPGEGCYALLLNHKGKLRSEMRVLRDTGRLLLDGEAAGWPALLSTARTYSLGRDVASEDETDTRSVLSLVGPAASSALDAAPPEREHAWVEGEHGIYVRTDLGVDVLCPANRAATVREALGVEPVSAGVAECLRIESGRPRLGRDMDGDTIPQEAGLNDRAVSFTKGCYVGQETVARLFYKGRPNRHLRGLALSAPARPGDELTLRDKPVGRLGSACLSPAHGPIALALVRREAEIGDEVAVGVDGQTARIVPTPFESTTF